MNLHRNIAGLVLATSILVTAGCATTLAGGALWPSDHRADRGPIGYFPEANGTSSLTIKIVDQRSRLGIQSIDHADTYNGVLFKLANSAKLKAPQLAAVSSQGGAYNMVFSSLPSDSAANYSLVAGLYRNVGTPADSADSAYSDLDAKVGEGASENFSLNPGENKSVTITINAVGQLSFDSTTYVLDSVMPTFLSGDTTITMTSQDLRGDKNPMGAELKAYFVDAASQTVAVATASIPPSSDAAITLNVPTVTGTAGSNYWVFAELATGSTVLSRRSRVVTVEPTASINVDPRGDGQDQ